ncbi:MAG: Hint domain-containing protein [Pseudomonadota bacterium]
MIALQTQFGAAPLLPNQVAFVGQSAPETLIRTAQGDQPASRLRVGDQVLTRGNGLQPVQWIGRKVIAGNELAFQPELHPIEIAPGALGGGLPERTLRVSPQHRILIEGRGAALFFGADDILAPAGHLAQRRDVHRVEPVAVAYMHILFHRPEVICVNGAWVDCFHPADSDNAGGRDEIDAVFPEVLAQSASKAAQQMASRGPQTAEVRPLFR